MRFLVPLVFAVNFLLAQTDSSFQDNITMNYDELIESYITLDKSSDKARLFTMGPTDSGRNLHLLLIAESVPDSIKLQEWLKGKLIILINNGIHPGEPCGIEASLKLVQEMVKKAISRQVVVAVIPAYNIGGMLNRNCCSRANQSGPEEYGFRGNARNLDLNRDFIKADALNTRSFYEIFHLLKPHIFVDTHTSNGADYQYVMTLISTQKDKLNPIMAGFLTNKMEPELYRQMDSVGYPMVPYVNVFGNTPDKGYAAFLETPRYASGYTALFNTLGFITEAHMLKPYADRVEATYQFLKLLVGFSSKNADKIIERRKRAFKLDKQLNEIDIDWTLDSGTSKKLEFMGFEYEYIPSKLSGKDRLRYSKDRPHTYSVKYYDTYRSTAKAEIPAYYIVPAAWREVPELLRLNNIQMTTLPKDTTIEVISYYIREYEFAKRPYEGHFPITRLEVDTIRQNRLFLKGDFLIHTEQVNVRFLVSVLEPKATDSYLRWNFYDEIFQQKEWFSSYVFEDEAERLLNEDEALRQKYESWKTANPTLAEDAFQSLYFIYRNSPAYEKEYLRYPVAKVF